MVTRFKGLRPHSEWVQTRQRNEALDCLLLALAAVRLAKVDLRARDAAVNAAKPEESTRPTVRRLGRVGAFNH